MKTKFLRSLTTGMITGAASLAAASGAGAASTTGQPHGITVTPAFQQTTIQASEAQHPINFSVTNNESSPQTLALSVADFNTLNESGGLFFVGTNPTALQKKYGLAKWLSLPQKQVTLQPKQTVTINAAVLNLPDLAAGGHYGALMLAAASPGAAQPGNNVALHPIASSLIFVTKSGGDTHKLGLNKVSLSRHFLGLPASVTLRFHNDGNTHLIPRGIVTITNSGGKLVSKGVINDDSGIILPETMRRYFVPLQNISHGSLPGRYTLRVDFRFDGLSQFRSYQRTILYVPLSYIFGLILLVAIATYAIRRWRTRAKTSKS